MKFVFVILHYLSYADTIECIESIYKACDMKLASIIIVDNHSDNGSGELLVKKYKNDSNIFIIKSNENLGYARGNNLGIKYAREHFDPDFIISLNNDTLLLRNDFLEIIENEYNFSNFSLLGPMVLTADGRCDCNPHFTELESVEKVEQYIRDTRKVIILNKLHLWFIYHTIGSSIRDGIFGKKSKKRDYIHRCENVPLHGCFIIFSRNFFEQLAGFYPKTFLYLEEDILYYQVKKYNLKSVYNPMLIVYHKEDSASNLAWKNKDKMLIQSIHKLNSAKIYLDLMKSKQ